MTDPNEALAELGLAAAAYEAAKEALETARAEAIAKVVAALKAGAGPTEVAKRSPFTEAHVRTIAREHGIPPAKPGIKRKPKV